MRREGGPRALQNACMRGRPCVQPPPRCVWSELSHPACSTALVCCQPWPPPPSTAWGSQLTASPPCPAPAKRPGRAHSGPAPLQPTTATTSGTTSSPTPQQSSAPRCRPTAPWTARTRAPPGRSTCAAAPMAAPVSPALGALGLVAANWLSRWSAVRGARAVAACSRRVVLRGRGLCLCACAPGSNRLCLGPWVQAPAWRAHQSTSLDLPLTTLGPTMCGDGALSRRWRAPDKTCWPAWTFPSASQRQRLPVGYTCCSCCWRDLELRTSLLHLHCLILSLLPSSPFPTLLPCCDALQLQGA